VTRRDVSPRLPAAIGGVALLAVAAFWGCRGVPQQGRDALQEAFREGTLTAAEARGHRVFLQRCATCHGAEGHGDGQNAYGLTPPPPDFQESLARVTPAERRRIIVDGTASVGRSPLCPPRGRSLSEDEVEGLLAWLDVASRPAEPEPTPAGPPRSR
jgi:mono/diheme cytochrome c family protein